MSDYVRSRLLAILSVVVVGSVGLIAVGWMVELYRQRFGQPTAGQRMRQKQQLSQELLQQMAALQAKGGDFNDDDHHAAATASMNGAVGPAAIGAAASSASSSSSSAPSASDEQLARDFARAQLFQQQGKFKEVLRIYNDLIARYDNRASPSDPINVGSTRGESIAMVHFCRVRVMLELGQEEDSIAAIHELILALDGNRRQDIQTLIAELYMMLTGIFINLRRFDDAQASNAKAGAIISKQFGPTSPEHSRVIGYDAELLELRGRIEESLPLHAQALACLPPQLGLDHPAKVIRVVKYAAALHALGRFDEANRLLKPLVDVYYEQPHDDENPPLFAHYYATRLIDQEAFKEAVVWALKAIQSPKIRDAEGAMRTITLVMQTTLLAAYDELLVQNSADDETRRKASELRASMNDDISQSNAPRAVSRCLATVGASILYVDPASVPAEEKEDEDDDDADDDDADDSDDGEIAGAAGDELGSSSSAVGKAKATVTDVVEKPPKTDFFGKMSLKVELVQHPINGVKLRAGNHLVATFQHPLNTGEVLITEHTITDADIAVSKRDPNQKSSTKYQSSTSLVLTTPGYFHASKKGVVEAVIDIFEDDSCEHLIGSHRQLLRCAFNTAQIKNYNIYSSLPSVRDLEVAVDNESGLSDLHHS